MNIPADAVVTVISSARMIYMERNQVGNGVAVDVSDGDASALIMAAKPTGNQEGLRP